MQWAGFAGYFDIMAGVTLNDCCSEECRKNWALLGDDVMCFRIQLFLVRHTSVSIRRPGCFHALREGGPRILVLRSIPPCAGGFWT